jgi:hypothetical protein
MDRQCTATGRRIGDQDTFMSKKSERRAAPSWVVPFASAVAVIVVVGAVVGLNWGPLTASTPSAALTPLPSPPSSSEEPTPTDSTAGVPELVFTYLDIDSANNTVEASGFIDGLVEEGGTCALALTSGFAERRVEGPSFADATTTQCGALTVSLDLLPAGEWTGTLSYESASYSAESPPLTVEVTG